MSLQSPELCCIWYKLLGWDKGLGSLSVRRCQFWQPSGRLVVPASCDPSSCCCTAERSGSVVWCGGSRGLEMPMLTPQGNSALLSLNRAPLFLNREEMGKGLSLESPPQPKQGKWAMRTMGWTDWKGVPGCLEAGSTLEHQQGLPAQAGRQQTLTSPLFAGLKERTEAGLLQGGAATSVSQRTALP